MKFSLIIPTFNSKKFIEKTINSILLQNYPDFEVLIADGGSTDKTLEIVSKFNFIKIVSTSDNGQSDAINRAYKFACGEIIAWQNSDDVYAPDCLKIVSSYFYHNPDIDCIYGDYNLIDESDILIRKCHSYNWNQFLFKVGRFVPLQPTFFWRKKVSDLIFPLDNTLKFCMDVDFIAKCDLVGFKFEYIASHLGDFRMHTLSKTTDLKNTLSVIREHRKVLISHYRYGFREKFFLNYYLTRLFLIKLVLNFLA